MAYKEVDIFDAVVKARESNEAGDRASVIRLLDKFTDGQFTASTEYKAGAVDSILVDLATATDPAHIRELVKQVKALARI